jgi:hypothetical protein
MDWSLGGRAIGGAGGGFLGQLGELAGIPRRALVTALMAGLDQLGWGQAARPMPGSEAALMPGSQATPRQLATGMAGMMGMAGGGLPGAGAGDAVSAGLLAAGPGRVMPTTAPIGPEDVAWPAEPLPELAPQQERSVLSAILSGGGYDTGDLFSRFGYGDSAARDAIVGMAIDPLSWGGALAGGLAGRRLAGPGVTGGSRLDDLAAAAGRRPAAVTPPPPAYVPGGPAPPIYGGHAPGSRALESERFLGGQARSPLAAAMSPAADDPVQILSQMPAEYAMRRATTGMAVNPAFLDEASAVSMAGYRPEMIEAMPGIEQLALSGGRLGQPIPGIARRYKVIDPALEEALAGYGWMSYAERAGGRLSGTLNYGPGQLPPFAAVRGGGVRPAGPVPPVPLSDADMLASQAALPPMFSPVTSPAVPYQLAGPPTREAVARAMAQESLRRLRSSAGVGAAERQAMLERLLALEAQSIGPNIDWVQRL